MNVSATVNFFCNDGNTVVRHRALSYDSLLIRNYTISFYEDYTNVIFGQTDNGFYYGVS